MNERVKRMIASLVYKHNNVWTYEQRYDANIYRELYALDFAVPEVELQAHIWWMHVIGFDEYLNATIPSAWRNNWSA